MILIDSGSCALASGGKWVSKAPDQNVIKSLAEPRQRIIRKINAPDIILRERF